MNKRDAGREKALRDVLELRVRLQDGVAALRQYPWDWTEAPLAELHASHVIKALDAYLDGQLSAQDMRVWASSIEARDDISVPQDQGEARQILFELVTPAIHCPVTPEQALSWKARLQDSDIARERPSST